MRDPGIVAPIWQVINFLIVTVIKNYIVNYGAWGGMGIVTYNLVYCMTCSQFPSVLSVEGIFYFSKALFLLNLTCILIDSNVTFLS